MNASDPLSLDFAALNTLCKVHANKSFSGAADELGTTQSTVSYTIERLRKAFADPLFVRQGGRIVATPRCDELVIEARLVLDQFSAMAGSQAFDPSSVRATIRISSNYYERTILLPKLIRAVRVQAPGLHIEMIPAQNKGAEQLQKGEIDLLLSPASLSLNGVYSKRLIKDRYVCLIDHANPLATGPFTEEMFRAANHAYVSFAEIWRSEYGAEIRRKGLEVNRVLSIANPENLSGLLEGTDMIAAVPHRIALRAADRMVIRDCPFPVPFQVSVYWTARTHRSKMHQWLRRLIVSTAEEVGSIPV